jgi:hypothetical protein
MSGKYADASEIGAIFIINDAIGKCLNSAGTPSPRETVLKLVEWPSNLHYLYPSDLVTSRPETDIEAQIRRCGMKKGG